MAIILVINHITYKRKLNGSEHVAAPSNYNIEWYRITKSARRFVQFEGRYLGDIWKTIIAQVILINLHRSSAILGED